MRDDATADKQHWLRALDALSDDWPSDRFDWTLKGVTALTPRQLRAVVRHLRAIKDIVR